MINNNPSSRKPEPKEGLLRDLLRSLAFAAPLTAVMVGIIGYLKMHGPFVSIQKRYDPVVAKDTPKKPQKPAPTADEKPDSAAPVAQATKELTEYLAKHFPSFVESQCRALAKNRTNDFLNVETVIGSAAIWVKYDLKIEGSSFTEEEQRDILLKALNSPIVKSRIAPLVDQMRKNPQSYSLNADNMDPLTLGESNDLNPLLVWQLNHRVERQEGTLSATEVPYLASLGGVKAAAAEKQGAPQR